MPSTKSREIHEDVADLFRSSTIASHQHSGASPQSLVRTSTSEDETPESSLLDLESGGEIPEGDPPPIIRGGR